MEQIDVKTYIIQVIVCLYACHMFVDWFSVC